MKPFNFKDSPECIKESLETEENVTCFSVGGHTITLKLWLDDQHDIVETRKPPEGYIACKTADEALKHILTGKVTFIDFDHDLGEDKDERGNEKNGYWLAKEIMRLAHENKISRIKHNVHSANPIGRGNINTAMRQANKKWEQHEKSSKMALHQRR